MMFGDIVAQLVVEQRTFDINRLIRLFCIATFFMGPLLWNWFPFLEKRVSQSSWPSAMKPLVQMVVDQSVMAPFINFMLLMLNGILRGDGLVLTAAEVMAKFPLIMLNNYKLWPLVQLCNFYLVPTSFRIYFVQFIGLFWNMYVSMAANT